MKLIGTIIVTLFIAFAMIAYALYQNHAEKSFAETKQQEELLLQEKAKQQEKAIDDKLSDTHRFKGEIKVGLDSYLGYFPLRSPEFTTSMLHNGYTMKVLDDQADYKDRAKKLANNELDFAVFTVDSYILNGAPTFPGKIIMVISESQGSDALVAKKEIDKINDLKHVTATLNSPSHHLIKASIIDFGLQQLKSNIRPANGSPAALQDLLAEKTDAAILWEPDVSKALEDPRFKVLLSTKNTSKLIVDILVASEKVVRDEPEKIDTFLKCYFPALKHYTSSREALLKAAMTEGKLTRDSASNVINSINWISLHDNATDWFGIRSDYDFMPRFKIIQAINLTDDILVKFGDFDQSPLQSSGAFQLLSSKFISKIHLQQAQGKRVHGMDNKFGRLNPTQWNSLEPVATISINPITFRPGTNSLTAKAKEEILNLKNILSRYSRYRLKIEGHTSTKGDPQLNRTLSLKRASAIKDFLINNHQLNPNRIKALGIGADQPLQREPAESYRAWLNRLPRVEFHLLEERY